MESDGSWLREPARLAARLVARLVAPLVAREVGLASPTRQAMTDQTARGSRLHEPSDSTLMFCAEWLNEFSITRSSMIWSVDVAANVASYENLSVLAFPVALPPLIATPRRHSNCHLPRVPPSDRKNGTLQINFPVLCPFNSNCYCCSTIRPLLKGQRCALLTAIVTAAQRYVTGHPREIETL